MIHIENKIFYILVGLLLLSGCEKKMTVNVNSEQELKVVISDYENLSKENKTKAFNNILNYYQFTESVLALEFIKEKAKKRDPIAVESIAIAKEFGVKIP
jgi:hypothetical protein